MSLTAYFTQQQIREHLTSLGAWNGQNPALQDEELNVNECRLCGKENLPFEAPPIYCTVCGARIQLKARYYTTGAGDTKHYFCEACYNALKSDVVELKGMVYPKAKLAPFRHVAVAGEPWVQCDRCQSWQHQICALFNGRRNDYEGGKVEFICPICLYSDWEAGVREPEPPSALSAGAKDLPTTLLSDHLEQRLARKLRSERSERAKALGLARHEVPRAEALVVRVVSSVDKKVEVRQRFLEIFKEENYPTEFPYKSKAVLLFQTIEGADVCLFGMYVQEFGVESPLPNQRRVYLAYLDSVKYFRPNVKTASGEALRTFVYHEILIGYLAYCRNRGFSSCYIWACPPLDGDDYILYCHPKIQRKPKSQNLREWYLTMLQKASDEGIVVEVTTLYDFFFVSTRECRVKVTAARLPYFEGDYLPLEAEDIIVKLQQEEEDARENALKKGKAKKQKVQRSSSRLVPIELASNPNTDTQLMQKLGKSVLKLKRDFILVHMHHACSHCRLFIVSGHRWVCEQCTNSQLCDKCYAAEQKRDLKDKHPINRKEVHSFRPIEVTEADVPKDTKDKDDIMETDIFDTRQAFLSLCLGNNYQFDTLRRAKHSSMMALYHMHNPAAPAFALSCNKCNLDIEAGKGWSCETCLDFDLCNTCKDAAEHPHRLTPFHERKARKKETREQRDLELREARELLLHASDCGLLHCQYPKCRSVKALFIHSQKCTERASGGGCKHCNRMWYLLHLHAKACTDLRCRLPRCRDLKEQIRLRQQEMDARRRAAVEELVRHQDAAEAGCSSSEEEGG